MAENHGLAHDKVAIATVGIVVQVRSADAGGFDGDLDLVGGWTWRVAGFLG